MIIVKTSRLILVAGNQELMSAEMNSRPALTSLLEATIPEEWPTEVLKDALPIFESLYQQHPDWEGWLHWYALLTGGDMPVLCGSIGFKGPPDETGIIETGYSVLPCFQGIGIASEMLAGILRFISRFDSVKAIIAETEPGNFASHRVLHKNGFVREAPAPDKGIIKFRYIPPATTSG